MTESPVPNVDPFWRRKRLEEMTESEWEAVCDGCGRCCLVKVSADDSKEVYNLDVGCELLDPPTGACSDYPNRLSRNVGCWKMTPAHIPEMDWMPPSCGYRRIFLGQDLEWWHPLVSGDPKTVRSAGVSAAGRFIRPLHAGPLEHHTIDWPSSQVTGDPRAKWETAMFGGVNASVPTPFGRDTRVDLDLMAAHCLWALANGCHGLAILDKAGEVASLGVDERIAIIEGLVSRGVPASKLLAGIGPASVADGARIAARADELGIRGVMLTVSAPAKAMSRQAAAHRFMPHHVLSGPIQDLMRRISANLHLYLSLSVDPAATAACLVALEAFMAQAPGRLIGVRDETIGCAFGCATLERFQGSRFEVYITDATALMKLVELGGPGLISPHANLLGKLCAEVMGAAKPQHMPGTCHAIAAGCRAIRSHPTVPAIKALLARHTGRSDWDRVRLPLRPPGAAERAALFTAFDAIGIKLRSAT